MGPGKRMALKTWNKKRGTILILSGPSGVGKTTLREALQKSLPDLHFSVSWTTRPARPGEKTGQDYRFVSRRQFEKHLEQEGFLEWAKVHNEYYGTPSAPIQRWLKKGQDVLLDIDIQGARQIKKKIPESVAVFILPPSRQELKKRLIGRETESLKKIAVRLKNAETELQAVHHFDYALMNHEIQSSLLALEAILFSSRFRVRNPANAV